MTTEKRLIDANAIEKHCRSTKMIKLFPEWKEFPYDMKLALIRYGKAWKEIIQNAPTVDAVEVVRCKECKFYELKYYPDNTKAMTCENSKAIWTRTPPDAFCSYGERRIENA